MNVNTHRTLWRLSARLIALSLLLGLVPLIVVSLLVDRQVGETLRDQIVSDLETTRYVQKGRIEDYFQERLTDIAVLAESVAAVEMLKASHRVFHEYEKRGETIGGEVWRSAIQDPLLTWLTTYVARYGYANLFLLDDDGHVVFTLTRHADLGADLHHGPLKESGLARLYAKAHRGAVLEDFSVYPPDNHAQAAFLGAPVQRDGVMYGIIVLQLSRERISHVTSLKQAQSGRSKRAYAVGKVGDALFYRSSDAEKTVQLGDPFPANPLAERALAGESGSDVYVDPSGRETLVSFIPIEASGLRWALITTIDTEEAFATVGALQRAVFLVAALCAVVVTWVGWFFSRSITHPLRQVIATLVSSSTQMATALSEQERISTQQAVSIHETNATMEELTASARQSAEQSEVAAQGADQALELAQFGMSRVEEALSHMTLTKERVEAIAQQILLLSDKTGQIRDITGMVSDFANETKMLAMNSAVEAVRAGEHGKGFSVLAMETRKLADESKRSAGRITGLVVEIQRATNSTVMATEEGNKAVDEGMAISHNTAETFREVEQTMTHASQGVQQIVLNIKQQSMAIRQVLEAIQNIHAGSKESASGISQVKEGVLTLNQMAQTLRSMI